MIAFGSLSSNFRSRFCGPAFSRCAFSGPYIWSFVFRSCVFQVFHLFRSRIFGSCVFSPPGRTFILLACGRVQDAKQTDGVRRAREVTRVTAARKLPVMYGDRRTNHVTAACTTAPAAAAAAGRQQLAASASAAIGAAPSQLVELSDQRRRVALQPAGRLVLIIVK